MKWQSKKHTRNAGSIFFGIALDRQIPAEPFPDLTPSEAKKMWSSADTQEEDKDSWEQLCWFIKTN